MQGAVGGPFATLEPAGTSAAPIALARAYLGDVALASDRARPRAPRAGQRDGFDVHVERFYANHFGRETSVRSAGSAPVGELTLAMDYRSEVLAVWVQRGAIYARLLPRGPAAAATTPCSR